MGGSLARAAPAKMRALTAMSAARPRLMSRDGPSVLLGWEAAAAGFPPGPRAGGPAVGTGGPGGGWVGGLKRTG